MTKTIERIKISLYAQNLKNVAGMFKGTSDPYAVVTQIANANQPSVQPKVLGKTEVIKNSLSPHWVKTFDLEYDFTKEIKINVGVYDEIRKGQNKSMGNVIFEIGDILGARGNIKAKRLKHGGTVFCRAKKAPRKEEVGKFNFQLRGIKLKNVDGLFGKSDPFFEVFNLINAASGQTWQIVYRSEVIKNDLNPRWKPVSLSLDDLCGGDRDQKVRITVKDWEKNGKHTHMGNFETTVNEIMKKKTTGDDTSKDFTLMKGNKKYGHVMVTAATTVITVAAPSAAETEATPAAAATVAGTAAATTAAAVVAKKQDEPSQSSNGQALGISTVGLVPMAPPAPRPTFVDYLSGGLELQLSVAVDFTGSNGDPRKPGTLHYIDRYGRQLNDYEKALTAVGGIIAKYDHDQKFPMMGFGAKYNGVIQHSFQLGPTAEVHGVSGMVDAYRNTFASGLTMSGPTVFEKVIEVAASQARQKQERLKRFGQQAYQILLILTDGAVTDVMRTKQAIASACNAPLSIVIVGIGNADFSTMQFLDDFAEQEGIRDICQFVEFRRYSNNKTGLTEATLDEIPDQVVDYFQSNGIQPLSAIRGSQLSLVPDDYNEEEEIPLDLNFHEDGEITLDAGGVYNAADYGGITPMAPPQPTAPQPHAPPPQQQQPYGLPPQPYAPQQQQQQQPSYMQPQQPQPYAPQQPLHNQPPQQPQPYAPQQPLYNQPQHQPVTAAAVPPVFYVQLPQGVQPGQQLQIQHPKNGQTMIVTVPAGVQAGGTFSVAY